MQEKKGKLGSQKFAPPTPSARGKYLHKHPAEYDARVRDAGCAKLAPALMWQRGGRAVKGF